MRVLAVCTWCPYPPNNGSRIRTYQLLRALARVHEVDAVAFCPDDDPSRWPTPVPGLERVHLETVAVDPFRYVAAPSWVKFLSPVPLCFVPSRQFGRAVRTLARRPYDAVVAMNTPAAWPALRVARTARVLDVDSALCFLMRDRHLQSEEDRLRTRISWWKAEQAEGWLMRRFETCTFTTMREVDFVRHVVRHSGCQVRVIPNGVDCDYHSPSDAPRVPAQLIYTGALTYSANYDAMRYFAASIYPLIREEVPEASLVITGSHKGVDLSQLSLDPSVRLTGYVDDVRPWVQASRVCVVPLRQGGGTRIKILEAMALGTPVIATSKGMEGLDVVAGEHLLVADEPADFTRQTLRLLRDEALARSLAERARELVVEHYDWRAIGRGFVDLVEEAVERHQRGSA